MLERKYVKRVAVTAVAFAFSSIAVPAIAQNANAQPEAQAPVPVPGAPAPISSTPANMAPTPVRMPTTPPPGVDAPRQVESIFKGGNPDTQANSDEDPTHFPWALSAEQHPWPIHYKEPISLNALNLYLPTEGEVKLMLPGAAADVLESSRATISKYLSNATTSANQAFGQNMDSLNDWLARVASQRRSLNLTDPWPKYQFTKEARAEAIRFKKLIQVQSAPAIERMSKDVRIAIDGVTPVMHNMQTQDLRMGWYNLLLQLRDGFNNYQIQAQTNDTKLLRKLDEFLELNPEVDMPEGPKPRKDGKPNLMKVEPNETPAAGEGTAIKEENRAPSKPVNLQEGTNWTAILTVLGALGVAAFMMFRKKASLLPGKLGKKVEPN